MKAAAWILFSCRSSTAPFPDNFDHALRVRLGPGQGGEQSAEAWGRLRGGVFSDPLVLSLLDQESGEGEKRWVTMGRNPAGHLLVVVHTYVEMSADRAAIRIISARRPTRHEIRSYEDG
ncbi:BrnT family toxin [Bradyrhizobium sp. CB1650]|uniref:BrnT family toxin n=1 Tax=Bradyrhizobium sp. CB1650 TaxID=3039153 RepID=UPI002434DC42|nr:BrnT family toxin [Bradyrhizobium sp. CB1650]WGD52976.1 BrnT family toxin [Bradyrhizobium sp. CB1650]